MQVFLIISIVRIMINAYMNAKNWLIKVCVNKGFIWNLCNCGCECDKSYDVGQYLGYENYKCRKKLIDKLVEEYSENIDEKEIYPNKAISLVCNSWTMYIILFSVFLTISIGTVLIYFYWYSKNEVITDINYGNQTTIYWVQLNI